MNLTWTQAFNGAQILGDELWKRHCTEHLPVHILIGRGGLALGSLLVRFCNLKNVHYLPIAVRESTILLPLKPHFVHWVSALEVASTIYLIDDIYDSGRTMEYVAEEIVNRGYNAKLVAVTLCTRMSARFRRGDHLVAHNITHKNYIYFPWEMYDPLHSS